jgi:hypothetical protein
MKTVAAIKTLADRITEPGFGSIPRFKRLLRSVPPTFWEVFQLRLRRRLTQEGRSCLANVAGAGIAAFTPDQIYLFNLAEAKLQAVVNEGVRRHPPGRLSLALGLLAVC